MHNNKALKEILDNEFDKQKNYDKIMKKVKRGDNMKKKKLLNIAAIFLVIVLVGVFAPKIYAEIQWNIQYKEFQERDIEYGLGKINKTVDEEKENIAMDYVVQNNVGIKVDSIMMTDDYFKLDLNIDIQDKEEISLESIGYGIAIYDENKNVYGVFESFYRDNYQIPYERVLYEDLGIKYDKNNIYENIVSNSFGMSMPEQIEDGTMKSKVELTSDKGFPRSKKIFVRIYNFKYKRVYRDEVSNEVINSEEILLDDNEWRMELEVPEEFYNRETINLKINEKVEGLEITKATISETGLILNLKMKGIIELISAGKDMSGDKFNDLLNSSLYVQDSTGQNYLNISLGTTRNEGEIRAKFPIGKEELENGIYLCVQIDGKEYKLRLEKSE